MSWLQRKYLAATADIVTVVVLVVSAAALLAGYRGRPNTDRTAVVRDFPAGIELELKGMPIAGTGNTDLVLIEFSDVQCPFCRKHATGVGIDLRREFVDTGRLKYGFANNPLTSIHPLAKVLAASAICAGQQQKFWQMYDRLYSEVIESDSQIPFVASDVAFSSGEFLSCLQDIPALNKIIGRDVEMARRVGLESTPNFVLGRIRPDGRVLAIKTIRGAQPLEVFRKAIAEVSRGAGT